MPLRVRRCARFLALAAAILLALPAASKPAKRRRPARNPLAVKPSAATDARVKAEIEKADRILAQLLPENLFESPYVVSAVYYHDGFLSSFQPDRRDGDPARRIIAHIVQALTSERKAEYVRLLHEMSPPSDDTAFVAPVPYAEVRARRRRLHRYAIDLFAREGLPVRSSARGIVLLAEEGWNPGDPFSTSSREGGNTVITFDSDSDRFFRYCHLASVAVSAGAVIEAGQTIGTVGHTGLNASRRGHGQHLHFEINQYDDGKVRPYVREELQALLRKAPAALR